MRGLMYSVGLITDGDVLLSSLSMCVLQSSRSALVVPWPRRYLREEEAMPVRWWGPRVPV